MRLNHPQGQAAEDAALAFLQRQGCRLVERNRHCPHGEIDLIMESGGVLLFVEVKYRKSAAFGGAAHSITPSKLVKLQKSAELYLQQHPKRGRACRIDAVLIEGNAAPVWLQNITG
ncbi:YraN family protein [Neisseria sp. 23W00296]|uniref:YraN family protein n=1 Tax=unclassified Neisseria TaxID=2623750 RepID=UPI000B8C10FC|nr:YraN family protein [Neisseria sp. KEM232]ASP16525.1 YraN family protein [Neisseria sp. KEM232]